MKNYIRKILVPSLLISGLSITAYANDRGRSTPSSGGARGGGGDPRVEEFLTYGRYIFNYLSSSPSNDFGINREKLGERIQYYTQASDDTHPDVPQIVFEDQRIFVCEGLQKDGCFYTNGFIRMSKISWDNNHFFSANQFSLPNCSLAGIELVRSAGHNYETGGLSFRTHEIYNKVGEICKKLAGDSNIKSPKKPPVVSGNLIAEKEERERNYICGIKESFMFRDMDEKGQKCTPKKSYNSDSAPWWPNASKCESRRVFIFELQPFEPEILPARLYSQGETIVRRYKDSTLAPYKYFEFTNETRETVKKIALDEYERLIRENRCRRDNSGN